MRATIEWSHALLEEGEQLLFGRLAVFSGGRTLKAIEAICDAEGDLPMEAFDGVSSLLDKSLLKQEEGPNEEPRFVMLETVHEFAREKLGQSAEAEQIKRLHAEYFLTLAEEAFPELRGPHQLEWLERLEVEHDNMRVALAWTLERKEVEVALRLGGALWWFWSTRGYYSEGRRWLEDALAMDGGVAPEVRAMALAGVGVLAFDQGELDRAKEACEEGLEFLAHEGREAKLNLLALLGWVAWQNDLGRAAELYKESLSLSWDTGMNSVVQSVREGFACVAGARGETERAAVLWGAAQTLHETKGIPRDTDFLAEADTRISAVRSGMGEEVWEEAWHKGRVMTLDEAVSYALEEEAGA